MREIVRFKSVEPMYTKEKLGLKNNTIRKVDMNDERFQKLYEWWMAEDYGDLFIEITRTQIPSDSFQRKIKDISFWDSYVIISWLDLKEGD